MDGAHPLRVMVEELNRALVTINTIALPNLSLQQVNCLIADALHCDFEQARALADLVYDKTQGNAFFTTEFLKSLFAEELLVFDRNQQQWQWEIRKIAAKGKTFAAIR